MADVQLVSMQVLPVLDVCLLRVCVVFTFLPHSCDPRPQVLMHDIWSKSISNYINEHSFGLKWSHKASLGHQPDVMHGTTIGTVSLSRNVPLSLLVLVLWHNLLLHSQVYLLSAPRSS